MYSWDDLSGKSPNSIDEAAPVGDVGSERAVVPDAAPAPASTMRHALALPKVSRFRLGGQQFEILAMRTEPSDANTDLLTILLRMTNNGPYPDGFVSLTTALELDQKVLILVAPQSAAEGELSFPVPRAATRATLWAKYANEETRIPLALAVHLPFSAAESLDAYGREKPVQIVQVIEAFPVDVPLPQPREFAVDGLSFAILDMRLDRYNIECAVLEVGVRARAAMQSSSPCSRRCRKGLHWCSATVPRIL